jgi:hypothetical protein
MCVQVCRDLPVISAYIVVFSVANRYCFEVAEATIRKLTKVLKCTKPIFLVATKVDLVRTRKITTEGKYRMFMIS